MNNRKSGTRYPLLLYRRVMSRLWAASLWLGLLLLLVWGWEWYFEQPLMQSEASIWLPAAGLVSLVFALFAFFGRNMAYVQAHRDHIRLVTPFLRTNISYRRLRNVYPATFQQLFPPKEASWAQRKLLEPFYGKTAVVVEVNNFPHSQGVLRLFLAPQMFSPRSRGLVLLVPDWMAFSTEVDSFRGTYQQTMQTRKASAWQASASRQY